MSIKTTHLITKEVALEIIEERLKTATDDEISEILEAFEESHFKNYTIVSEDELYNNSIQKYPMLTIDDKQEFYYK